MTATDEDEAPTASELGVLHAGFTMMNSSTKAWMYYTRAILGRYIAVESKRNAQINKTTVAAEMKKIKVEIFAYKGQPRYEKSDAARKFFSKCDKLWKLEKAYSKSIFFNGNIPFTSLGRLTAHEEQLYLCAGHTGCAARFKDVNMPDDDIAGKALVERFLK